MGFLKKHCQMAWEMAVKDCKLICDGLTDVEQRKSFVSSFTNALELGFKQILIDNNNRNVIDAKNLDNLKKSDPVLYNGYMKSPDLNSFFGLLQPPELKKFYSASISKLKSDAIDGIVDKALVENQIDVLLGFRNAETHFYIDENDFISFQEFQTLCDLLKRVQDFFIYKNIIDHVPSGTPNPYDKKHVSYFDADISTYSSYEELIKNSKSNNYLLNQFETYSKRNEWDIPSGWCFYVSDVKDLYSIAFEVFEHHGIYDPDRICLDFLMNLNEFYRRFVLMERESMLNIERHDGPRTMPDGSEKDVNFVFISKTK